MRFFLTVSILLGNTVESPTSSFSNTHRFLAYVPAPFRRSDDRGGVRLAQGHVGVRQGSSAEGPRRVHVTTLDALQLWDPPPYVVALKGGRLSKETVNILFHYFTSTAATDRILHCRHSPGPALSC